MRLHPWISVCIGRVLRSLLPIAAFYDLTCELQSSQILYKGLFPTSARFLFSACHFRPPPRPAPPTNHSPTTCPHTTHSHATYSHTTHSQHSHTQTWRHRSPLCVAGVALMALGWRAWFPFGAMVAAAVCVAGVALGDIHLHLRGRSATYGTGLALVARLVAHTRLTQHNFQTHNANNHGDS